MKTSHLARWLVGIELVILGGIVVHAPLTVWTGMVFPDLALGIKVWKEFLLGLALLGTIVLITRESKWKELLADWAIRLSAAYALLHILLLGFMWRGVDVAMAGLLIDLRYVLFFVLTYVLLSLFPVYKRFFVAVAAGGAAVVIGFAVLQLTVLPHDILKHIGYGTSTILPYLTVDLNPEYVRINSTLRGPNPVGAYAGLCLALIAAYVTQYRRRVSRGGVVLVSLLAIGSLAALWASYSRSAIVAAVIMLIVVMLAASGLRLKRDHWIIGSAIVFALIGGIIAARDTAFVSNVILHENPAGGSATKSNDAHLESLDEGTRRATMQPLGDGIGSTGSASLRGDDPIIIENQYLSVAHETGWIGLGLFIGLFGLIFSRLWQRRDDWLALGLLASGIGLGLVGVLLPVWTDDTISLLWWGLAGVAIALSVNKREEIHGKKRTHH